MGYILGVCPQCNNVMSMPDDSEKVRCPTCQAEVFAAEAAAIAGESRTQQPNAGNPYQNAANMTSYTPPMFGAGAPLLANWKTNVLFTILGVLAAAAINGFTGASVDAHGNVTSNPSPMVGFLALAYIVFCIVYAAKIYPSYFTDKPMLASSEAISFLNCFVGGLIFGLIWNHNLTRGEKGIATIVFIVLIAASFVLAFVLAFLIVMGAAGSMA